MTDNVELNLGSGGEIVASDEIGGAQHQQVKVEWGADGTATPVTDTTPLPVLNTDRAAARDAFGRYRVSEPTTLFDSKLLAGDKSPLLWDEELVSGAGITGSTPTASKPYEDFVSTVSTAGRFVRQTRRRFNYQPGKSQLVLMTGVLDLSGGGTGVDRRIGYFDDDNGIFFHDAEGTVSVVVRSNDSGTPADTSVVQASWNIDAFDGTGPSGITADWSTAQIFVFDFQWLSIGRIRFGLEINGALYYCHEYSTANSTAIPTMSTPNLPARYEMETTAASVASSMRCICTSIISEGGADPLGSDASAATVAHVDANAADSVYAVVGIRLKADRLGTTINTTSISMLTETNDDFEWQLIFNPTVADTFAFSDVANSACQSAVGATANTVTGGTVIARGFGDSQFAQEINVTTNSVKLGAKVDGTPDELVLCARPLGSNCDVQGAMVWREEG